MMMSFSDCAVAAALRPVSAHSGRKEGHLRFRTASAFRWTQSFPRTRQRPDALGAAYCPPQRAGKCFRREPTRTTYPTATFCTGRVRAEVIAMHQPSRALQLTVVALVLLASTSYLRSQEPGTIVAADKRVQGKTYVFKETGKELPYALFVPSKYDASKKWPL